MQRVVTWNVDWWQRLSAQANRLPAVLDQPEAVWLLQELRNSAMRLLEESWPGEVVLSVDVWPAGKRSWSSTAVLLPAGPDVVDAGCVKDLPRPQRGLWVAATTPSLGDVTFVSWHGENAAGGDASRRRKMSGYAAMDRWLASRGGTIVLGADLNSWRDPVDLVPTEPGHPFFEEHRFVGPEPAHGLVDAHRRALGSDGRLDTLRTTRPEGPLNVSYVLSNGIGHRMDRIYTTPDLGVSGTGYDLDEGRRYGSDHALHHADLNGTAPRVRQLTQVSEIRSTISSLSRKSSGASPSSASPSVTDDCRNSLRQPRNSRV